MSHSFQGQLGGSYSCRMLIVTRSLLTWTVTNGDSSSCGPPCSSCWAAAPAQEDGLAAATLMKADAPAPALAPPSRLLLPG